MSEAHDSGVDDRCPASTHDGIGQRILKLVKGDEIEVKGESGEVVRGRVYSCRNFYNINGSTGLSRIVSISAKNRYNVELLTSIRTDGSEKVFEKCKMGSLQRHSLTEETTIVELKVV